MPLARQIIADAFLEIGIGAPGEVLSADLEDIGLRYFQRQLNAWRADALTLAVSNRLTPTWPSGQQSQTIGPTGQIVTALPVFLEQVRYTIPGTNPPVTVPIAPMSDGQFQSLNIQTLQSGYPLDYYYQTSVTGANGTITLWPVPNQNLTLVIYVPLGPAEPATLQTVMTVPPAYEDAFHYDLAYRLCGPMGRPIPDQLPQLRTQALMTMKRPNLDPGMLAVDAALTPGSRGGAYNVLSDTSSGASGR